MPSSKSKASKAVLAPAPSLAPIHHLSRDLWPQITSHLQHNDLIHLFIVGNKHLSAALALTTTFKARWELIRFPDLNRVHASASSLLSSTEHLFYESKISDQLTPQFDWRNRFSSLKTLNLNFYGCLESVNCCGPINALWPSLEELSLQETIESAFGALSTFFDLLELPTGLRIFSIRTLRTIVFVPQHLAKLPLGLEVHHLHAQSVFTTKRPHGLPAEDWRAGLDGATITLPPLPSTLRSLVLNKTLFNGWRFVMSELPPSLTFFSFLGYVARDPLDEGLSNVVDWKTGWTEKTAFDVSTIEMLGYTIPESVLASLPPSVTHLDCNVPQTALNGSVKFDKRLISSIKIVSSENDNDATPWTQVLLDYTHLKSLNILFATSIPVLDTMLTHTLQTLIVSRVNITALPPNLTSLTFSEMLFPEDGSATKTSPLSSSAIASHSLPSMLRELYTDIFVGKKTVNDVRVIKALPTSIEMLVGRFTFDCLKALHELSLLGRIPSLRTLELKKISMDAEALGMIPDSVRNLELMIRGKATEKHKNALKRLQSSNLVSFKYYIDEIPTINGKSPYPILKYLPSTLKSLSFTESYAALPKSLKWPPYLSSLTIDKKHSNIPLPLPKTLTMIECAPEMLPKKVTDLPLFLTRFTCRLTPQYFKAYQVERNKKVLSKYGYENMEPSGRVFQWLEDDDLDLTLDLD